MTKTLKEEVEYIAKTLFWTLTSVMIWLAIIMVMILSLSAFIGVYI